MVDSAQQNKIDLFIGESMNGNHIFFNEDEYNHIKAKRISNNDLVHVFVNNIIYLCRIDSLKDRRAVILKKIKDAVSPSNICIACAFPKGKRKSFLVEKLTEIGIRNLIPLNCARAVYTPDEATLTRLKKIVISAFKQSQGSPMNITPTMNVDEVVEFAKSFKTKLLLNPNTLTTLPELCKSGIKSDTICVIGPEGGLQGREVSRFESNGFVSVKLNTNILRIETCAIYMAAILKEIELIN